MIHLQSLVAAVSLLLTGRAIAEPVQVTLGAMTVVGDYNAATGVDSFLGIKYANHKRFERPVMVNYDGSTGTIDATTHAPACVQVNNATGHNTYGNTEDCLFLEIYRPHSTENKLPVLVWIHGGGGTAGAANEYIGDNFVKHSKSINMPVVLVSINYRLAAWGMLGGKEASRNNAVNLALYDQQAALGWVQKNINSFGGDSTKVTLWGMSSGSMSVNFHYLHTNSQLFRAGIMQSGNVYSVPALATEHYQNNYDGLVSAAGCSSSADSLKCLKEADLSVLQNAVNVLNANSGAYSTRPWGFVIDGDIIPDVPSKLIASGKFAKKPFIHGDTMDEGTFYPKPTPMETVDAMWSFLSKDYLGKGSTWLSNENTKAKVLELYPEDPAQGSPFNTGPETFGFGAQYKRAAALYGDIRYQAPRRNFLSHAVKNGVRGWAYQFNQFTPGGTPAAYGVHHVSDMAYVWLRVAESKPEYYSLAKKMVSHWVAFAHNMDPNFEGSTNWPTYGAQRNLMGFTVADSSIVPDDFRKEAMDYLNSVQGQFGNPL